jgi:V/A-type H+-transporting ATPase subunit E
MANEIPQSSGVQELIARIRDDGVEAGNRKAEEIMAEARREATRLISEAQAQAEATQRKASLEIEANRHAALEALKLAARDTRLQLEAGVIAAFESHIKRLVNSVTNDGSYLRALIMVLAGQVAEQYPRDQKLEILVSDLLLDREEQNPEHGTALRDAVLGVSAAMLREGVEIVPSSEVSGGVKVRLVGENLEFDLTNEAISKLLLKHLLPRYRSILEGTQ